MILNEKQTPDAGAVINVVVNPEEVKIIPLNPCYVRDKRFISLTDLFNTVTIVPTNCVFTKSNSSIDSQTQQGFRIGSTVGSNVISC